MGAVAAAAPTAGSALRMMRMIVIPRGLLHAGIMCLWCACCGWSGPSGATAFMSPLALLRTHSCSAAVMERRDRKRVGVAVSRHEACSMVSSDTTDTATKLFRQRGRDRVARTKSNFVAYTGPAETRARKLSAEQQARKENEQLLGKRIQRSAQLLRLKKQLSDRGGDAEAVTDKIWAEAAGETEESLRRVLEAGASAKQALVETNLGVVYNIVEGYLQSIKYGRGGSGGAGSGHAIFAKTDLMQEATVGLICAVERFDPARGFRFATYAQWWVRKYLNECLQNQNRMIRIPITLAYRISKVKRLKDQLRMELGRAPTKEELAAEAGCTLEQLDACFDQGALSVSSLEQLSGFGRVRPGGNSGFREESYIADETEFFTPPQTLPQAQGQAQVPQGSGGGGEAGTMAMVPQGAEAAFMQMSLREDLRDALFRLLDATERQCLVLRYGLKDGAPKSVEETAKIMEFCDPDDVRIITRQAMVKLREGCLPKEKEKLMSYLSRYEPETVVGSKTRSRSHGSGSNTSKRSTTSSSGSDGTRKSAKGDLGTVDKADGRAEDKERDKGKREVADEEVEEEGVVWDFSNHGQEELQTELNRYLKRLRLEKDEEEHEGTKWSKRALAKGGSRRKRNGTSSKYQQETARRREERLRRLERDREAKEHQRKREAEWERERMLQPMRVGSGAGSAVIGDLEPKPNSREASQLEHLSRLLWDGEEPADFALTYGQRSDRPSIP